MKYPDTNNHAIAAQRAFDREAHKRAIVEKATLDLHREPVPYERKGDGLDWARGILAREAAGEDVGLLPSKWAHEVLDEAPEQRQPGQDETEASWQP